MILEDLVSDDNERGCCNRLTTMTTWGGCWRPTILNQRQSPSHSTSRRRRAARFKTVVYFHSEIVIEQW